MSLDGLLLVDKPIGPTSHDIVARARHVLGERRIGHTGTLDPLASGLLALVLGRATRLARFLTASDKSYDAEIRLGVATDTYDAHGIPVTPPYEGAMPGRDEVERTLDAFRGTFLQQPPAYSAKKVDGQRSYTLARANRLAGPTTPAASALPAPASVTAHAIILLACAGDTMTLRVDCSAGFYIRSLAHDVGQRLGVGAHLTALRRTRSGAFTVASARTMDALERHPSVAAEALIPMAEMLPELVSVALTPEGVRRAERGQNLGPADAATGWAAARLGHADAGVLELVRLLDPAGDLVGLAAPVASGGLLHPSVVLR
ncbi:MAG TPA: tRNA pseudouridine(55) synthase TruB [Vicinamibacterales bacterium]|jgi:tRNA pseudouridine55 synthase|nr:tRNA pseudouridine(55) synthase TruB [Vicinamibacterales bacterium]